ncbi:hypothetical protein CC86DRAFT_405283 [Ophiobolus disseminans]|uniref:Uncharacterized protein n=1 Tax=Ophiobolus disseminans TaxID=1469910 RepID=A0A6A7A6B5_9PLEO|nr:hypothetical protein CC86DRAFT_405283 [Ophiobolus disseminans]
MFDVGGVENLAGGSTGGEPYKGKHGQERWAKMRENVLKEWEAEQAKKDEAGQKAPTQPSASEPSGGSGAERSALPSQSVNNAGEGQLGHEQGAGHDAKQIEVGSPEVKHEPAKTEGSKLHKLKEKLLKH